jgi:hypothetical protein
MIIAKKDNDKNLHSHDTSFLSTGGTTQTTTILLPPHPSSTPLKPIASPPIAYWEIDLQNASSLLLLFSVQEGCERCEVRPSPKHYSAISLRVGWGNIYRRLYTHIREKCELILSISYHSATAGLDGHSFITSTYGKTHCIDLLSTNKLHRDFHFTVLFFIVFLQFISFHSQYRDYIRVGPNGKINEE